MSYVQPTNINPYITLLPLDFHYSKILQRTMKIKNCVGEILEFRKNNSKKFFCEL